MKLPADDALDPAIMWLRLNEGADGEADRCKAVADWLEHQQTERQLRQAAREGGVTVARLRQRIRTNSPDSYQPK